MTELHAVGSEDQPVQTEFHGFPVADKKFALKKAEGYTDKELKEGQHIKGVWEGTFKGFKYDAANKKWDWSILVNFCEIT